MASEQYSTQVNTQKNSNVANYTRKAGFRMKLYSDLMKH